MRISINLTQAAQEKLAKLTARHPMASRAALAAYVLDAGFEKLLPDEGVVFHEEPADRLEAMVEAGDVDAINFPDATCQVAANPFDGIK